MPAPPDSALRAAFVLRSALLARLAAAARAAAVPALLVKGAGLALTTYRPPWSRPMSDVDVLVRPADEARLLDRLLLAGLSPAPDRARNLGKRGLRETGLLLRVGTTAALLELHTSLDKVVSRTVDYDALFARADPAERFDPTLHGLFVPAPEDHALLVALHLARDELQHEVGFTDLAALLGAGLDAAVLVERARAWQLRTALYLALRELAARGSTAVPEGLLEALEPSPVRTRALDWLLASVGTRDPGRAGSVRRVGSWALRQAVLRDDTVHWCLGVLRQSPGRLGDAALEALRGVWAKR